MSGGNIDASIARAGHMLERATWAASSFATYDREHVVRIVTAVADAAYAKSREYAEWAVKETGFGVVEHKVIKNQACSRGILEQYRDQDFVTPRVDVARKIVKVPRPAGVVLALTPSTNPVATVYFKILLSLMTRNAVVISPHPKAQESCADAARVLGQAAVLAGAPDGVIQCVTEPSVALIDALMSDARTNVILATGGSAVVRSAYSSGNPAIGVGPGNVPVFVDATADAKSAAKLILDSKAFDNSIFPLALLRKVLATTKAPFTARSPTMAAVRAMTPDSPSNAPSNTFPHASGRISPPIGCDFHFCIASGPAALSEAM